MLDSALAEHNSEASRLLRQVDAFREAVRGFRFAEWLAQTGEPAAVLTPVWRELCAGYGVDAGAAAVPSGRLETVPETVQPFLKHSTPEILRNVFGAACVDPSSPSVAAWAPALLRGSELSQGRLVPKFRELWRVDESTALRGALLVACLLERYGAHVHDLRYLNAVLKIVDGLPSSARARPAALSGNGLLWLYLGLRIRVQLGALT